MHISHDCHVNELSECVLEGGCAWFFSLQVSQSMQSLPTADKQRELTAVADLPLLSSPLSLSNCFPFSSTVKMLSLRAL